MSFFASQNPLGIADDDGNTDIVDKRIVGVMFESFQDFYEFLCCIGKFFLQYMKTVDFNMYGFAHHIRQAVPEGIPVFSVVIGKVKGFLDDFVDLQVVFHIGEIDDVGVSVFVYGMSYIICSVLPSMMRMVISCAYLSLL